jgi:hypothetical protein
MLVRSEKSWQVSPPDVKSCGALEILQSKRSHPKCAGGLCYNSVLLKLKYAKRQAPRITDSRMICAIKFQTHKKTQGATLRKSAGTYAPPPGATLSRRYCFNYFPLRQCTRIRILMFLCLLDPDP